MTVIWPPSRTSSSYVVSSPSSRRPIIFLFSPLLRTKSENSVLSLRTVARSLLKWHDRGYSPKKEESALWYVPTSADVEIPWNYIARRWRKIRRCPIVSRSSPRLKTSYFVFVIRFVGSFRALDSSRSMCRSNKCFKDVRNNAILTLFASRPYSFHGVDWKWRVSFFCLSSSEIP